MVIRSVLDVVLREASDSLRVFGFNLETSSLFGVSGFEGGVLTVARTVRCVVSFSGGGFFLSSSEW